VGGVGPVIVPLFGGGLCPAVDGSADDDDDETRKMLKTNSWKVTFRRSVTLSLK
jgi:hypothetical protein